MPHVVRSDHIQFYATVDCTSCDVAFEATWRDESIDIEQIVDPPEGEQTCPACGEVDTYEYPGWFNYSDA